MIKVTDAKAMRDAAFESAVRAAGKTLEAELAAAGDDREARRTAWKRYGDAQDKAGAAYRAAQAAEAVQARACPLCGTPAGQPCQPRPEADHLARWLDAFTAGHLTKQYMAMTVAELVVIDTCAVISARPEPGLGALLAAGHTLTYEPEVTGGWFALLRTGDGRLVENGNGPTKADALAHLTDRLERAR